MQKGRILIILILGGMMVIGSGQSQQIYGQNEPKQPATSIQGITTYVDRGPIEILNDSAFGSDGYNFTGSGTYGDPYQITGYNITNSQSDLIYINSTTKYFSISNCYLNGSNSDIYIIYLENVTHGTIESNMICDTINSGIILESSNNSTVLNNIVYDCSLEGINLNSDCNNNTLSNNTIHDSDFGIYLDSSCNNNAFSNNTIHDCGELGIYLDSSSNNNTLAGNTIYNIAGGIGILLENCNNNTLSSNTIYNCPFGFYLLSSSINTLSANTIHECGTTGIGLDTSSNNTILNNIVHDCGWGIYQESSSNNTFTGNTIYNCSDDGIELNGAINNTLLGNTIYNCSNYGIEIVAEAGAAKNNTFSYNNVYNNTDYGIYFDSNSDNNSVKWNNFVDNNVGTGFNQSYDAGTNNNISYNYWDDHTSPDNPPDGIVDTPYNIEGGSNQDPSPLTTPVLPTVTILTPLAQDYGVETITVILSGRLSIQYQYYIEGEDSENRTWTTSEERTLANGAYTLHAYCSDILGNTVHSSVMFTIDTTAPTITLTSPTNTTVHPSGTTIDVAVTDAHLHIVLYLWDGNPNQTWSGEYETVLPTGETQHILYVYANDSVDNWASEVFVFTTDDTAPAIELDSPKNDTSHPAGTMINLTVIDTHLETVLHNWDGGTNQTLTTPYSVTLPTEAGQHVLRVYAKDSAGHWTAKTYVFTTQRKPVDLGPLIGVSVIGVSVATLAGGSYFFLKKKGITIRDLLGREPPESPESPED